MDIQNVYRPNREGGVTTYQYDRDRFQDPNYSDSRKVEPDKKKGWQVTEMWARHHEIARLVVLGNSNRSIAKELGVSEQMISNVRNSPVVKDQIAILSAARDAQATDLGAQIREMAPIALMRMREALEEGKVLGKEMSAREILTQARDTIDREIGKPVQRVDSRNIHGHFTIDDINEIKERAKELAASSGQIANEED